MLQVLLGPTLQRSMTHYVKAATLFCCLCYQHADLAADETTPTFQRERFASLTSDKIALMEEFFNAYTKLKDFYSNSTISARAEYYRVQTDKEGIRLPGSDVVLEYVTDYEYRSLGGDYFRLDLHQFKPDGTTLTGSSRGIVGPKDSFLLSRDLKSQKYVLRGRGKNREVHLSTIQSYLISIAPYSFGPSLLENEIFGHDDAVIESVTVTGDGDDAVTVVERKIAGQGVGDDTTRFELLHNRHWAVKRIESVSRQFINGVLKPTHRSVHLCEYDESATGFPQLSRVVYEMYGADESAADPPLWSRMAIQITGFDPKPSELVDFDVSAMITKIEPIQESRSAATWLLILGGVAVVVAGVLLARSASKRNSPGSAQR
jgi:hypothetical protein